MPECSLSWIILIFTLLESIAKTHLTVYDSSHGFIPNSHDRYIMQDISSMHEELSADIRSSSLNNIKLHLKFDPEFLDFKQRPLGVPHVEKVRLINTDRNKSIDMTSISGSTVHFHSSFFENKKIPPLGNTTFNVVFLGREEGSIESSLYIHTTEGHLKYQVKGASVFSPYRLRPIVGIKLPINTSFSPLIYMHNPHVEPIQIVEVYSSGGDFHLELPSGELEGPKDLWEIPPLETKAVIRVRFYARSEQNHTAYVRIKLNNTEEILVVPLEVEVTSTAGLFNPQGSIDFGVGGSLDPPKQVKLYLQNPLKKVVKIHSVTTTSKAIKIEHENVKVPSDSKNSKNDASPPYEVATLTLDWKTAFETKEFSGKIIVKYKSGKGRTEIPYYITIVEGGLSYNSSTTKYFIKEKADSLSVRSVVVKNDFPTSVMLINVTLPKEAQSYFFISDFMSVILKSKEERNVFSLKLKNGVAVSNLKLNSFVMLKTNVSEVEIPLYTYNGKLKLHLPFSSKDNSLDLGLISIESKKDTYLLLLNRNPVSVTMKQMSTSLPVSTIDLIGCDKGDVAKALLKDNYRNMTRCAKLRSNEYAILRLTVRTSRSEAQQWGEINIQTQYEQLSIPVHFKVAQGKLEIGPDRLVFDQCFPGKICSHPLRVHSTFNDPMVIEDILSIPPDSRITSKHSGHIMARATKVIGHLYLDPNLKCQNECYLGMQPDNTAQWLKTLTLTKLASEIDLNLVNIFYNRYLNQTSNGQPQWQNLTMRLDTSEVKGHLFKTRVKMSWPSLLSDQNVENKSVFTFPLTQVGNITYRNLTIRNPSTLNVLVQLVFDHIYPGVEMLKEGLPPDLFPGSVDSKKSRSAFFFPNLEDSQKDNFGKLLNIDVNSNSLSFILKPGENYTVKIGYQADEVALDSAFVFIRNNLTILEIIQLKGQGAYPNFKFGNRKPGSPQPLQFELTDKHLKDCEREKNRKYPVPNLTVKRSFTARNTGDITVYINSFHINSHLCEGFGFKVLNCEPFALAPNGTKKIDIAFTPDFTLSKITRTLILDTSLNYPVNYTLVTTVPHYYLALCTSVLTRPTWESILYYLVICVMFFSLVFIVVAAILESERIIKLALNVISRQSSSVQPTLDLRLIGAQTRSEIQTTPKIDAEEPKAKEKHLDRSTKQDDAKLHKSEDKYTVLVPTTGKVKKKLGKAKSSDTTIESIDNNNKKHVPEKPQKRQVETKTYVTEPECQKKNYLKEKKAQNKKESKQIEVVQVPYEEETSSTTTESSNNEEIEKPVKLPLKKCNSRNDNQKQEETEIQHPKVERRRSSQKHNHKKEMKENIQDNKLDVSKDKPKPNKCQKERKEKQHPNPKKIIDRTISRPHSETVMTNSTSTRVSPSIPSTTIWGENRATFSDVVARSEQGNTASRLPQTPSTKPTMYVEPYKQSSTELGPIGSRKENYWSGNVLPVNTSNDQFNQIQMSSSNSNIFENSVNADNSNTFLDLNTMRESSILNFMQPNAYQQNTVSPPVQDPWRSTSSTNTLWDSMFYTSLNEPAQPTSLASPDTCWSWGSPVWRPQVSDTTRTPTRTPPGFAPHRDLEENPQQQTDSIYDPFGVNNIWTNQQSNPWNYPHGQ